MKREKGTFRLFYFILFFFTGWIELHQHHIKDTRVYKLYEQTGLGCCFKSTRFICRCLLLLFTQSPSAWEHWACTFNLPGLNMFTRTHTHTHANHSRRRRWHRRDKSSSESQLEIIQRSRQVSNKCFLRQLLRRRATSAALSTHH